MDLCNSRSNKMEATFNNFFRKLRVAVRDIFKDGEKRGFLSIVLDSKIPNIFLSLLPSRKHRPKQRIRASTSVCTCV